MINPEMKAMRDGYGEGLVEAGKRNEKVVVLVADLTENTKTDLFRAEFSERFFEMGISEQNMMGVAAGMAACGKIPFVNSFACFNPGRNWEQMRLSVCLSGNNVKVIGGHAGFGNGTDGGNQQMFEDIALTRVLPHLTVVVPADYDQAQKGSRDDQGDTVNYREGTGATKREGGDRFCLWGDGLRGAFGGGGDGK